MKFGDERIQAPRGRADERADDDAPWQQGWSLTGATRGIPRALGRLTVGQGTSLGWEWASPQPPHQHSQARSDRVDTISPSQWSSGPLRLQWGRRSRPGVRSRWLRSCRFVRLLGDCRRNALREQAGVGGLRRGSRRRREASRTGVRTGDASMSCTEALPASLFQWPAVSWGAETAGICFRSS